MTPAEARNALEDVSYKGWQFWLEPSKYALDDGYILRGETAPVLDAYGSGEMIPLKFAEFIPPLDYIHDRGEFARHIRTAIRNVEQHEADEWFKFGGKRIFNPHKGEHRARTK